MASEKATVRRMAVGLLQIGQHDPDAAAPKAQRDAGGEIARPADQRKHRYTPLCRLPAVTGQVSRFASAAARS